LQKTATPTRTGIQTVLIGDGNGKEKRDSSNCTAPTGRGIQRALTDNGNASRYRNSKKNGIGRGANIVGTGGKSCSIIAGVGARPGTQESARIHTGTRAGSCTGIWMAVFKNLSWNFILVREFHPQICLVISSS
jgi:hypothetical protein